MPYQDFAGRPGDLPGQFQGPFRELAGIGELADEVQPQCFGGVDLAAGQDQFAGDGAADEVV